MTSPTSTLLITQKQLGDTVLLEPASARFALATGSRPAIVCKESFLPIIELFPSARPFKPGEKFDNLWVFERGSKASLLAFRMRARKKRLRLRETPSLRWFHRLVFGDVAIVPRAEVYEARWYWDATGLDLGAFRPPQLNQPPGTWSPPIPLPPAYLLLNPTASELKKSWAPESWGAALTPLMQELRLPLVVTCGGPDWALEHTQQIVSRLPAGQTINLAGQTNVKQFAYAISRAALVFTVDGACSHLGQAFKRKVVTVFSDTNRANPAIWHYGSGTSLHLYRASLSVEAVQATAKNLLSRVPAT